MPRRPRAGMRAVVRAVVRAGALALVPMLAALPGAASAQSCRQSLVLGLDVSGSVDDREYRQQLDGLAAALDSPPVRAALLQSPGAPVALAVFEWSGRAAQRLVADWALIDSAPALDQFTATLRSTARQPMPRTTALGEAMRHGAQMLARGPACTTRTIDISGDGRSNDGARPEDVVSDPLLSGVIVNALVIGAGGRESRDLEAYFRARVRHGPGAFVELADGFDDYRRAMELKLLRELQGLSLSVLRQP